MRLKSAQLLILVLITAIIPVKGQTDEKRSRWSIAIGYAPVYTFNISPLVFDTHDFYYKAVSGRVTYILSDRFSILTGVSTRHIKIDMRYDLFPDAYLTKDFLEFPIQLNFNIHKPSDSFSPYIKIALINSLLHSRLFQGPMPWTDSEYNLLADFGIGTNLRISKPLSIACEINTGCFLTYQPRDRAFLNGFFGLQYQF